MSDDVDDLLGITARPELVERLSPAPIAPTVELQHKRKPRHRMVYDMSRIGSARDTLRGLPADGETWHTIMSGSYDPFDMIPALLELVAPAKIETLHLATLGFNAMNARRLLELMDAGKDGRCTMIVSCYYEADRKEKDTCKLLRTELPRRGGRYCAVRNHAKLIVIELDDGRRFVFELSANLRGCSTFEQFTVTQDAGLFDFYTRWMEDTHDGDEAHKREARAGTDPLNGYRDMADEPPEALPE